MLVGHSTIEQRRFLQLAERALATQPDGSNVYSEVAIRLVRATTADAGVGQAVRDGRRAVELAQEGADELLTAALAGYSRALYFAGELDEAWEAALRVLEHPDAERRAPSHAVARSTLALVAVERGLLPSARAPRREGEGDRRRDRHQPKLARRECSRRPRCRAGRRGQTRRRRARAHLRRALPQRRDRDRLPRMGARPPRPRPRATRASRRGRSDDARGTSRRSPNSRTRGASPRWPTRSRRNSRPR